MAVAFFGDGATNQGYYMECLNFAKVHELPMLFVCENNLYMEFTPIEEVTAGPILARPQAMEVPAQSVDGNDVWAVREAAGEALDRARDGGGPSFLEVLTYRFVGHSRSDPGAYRKPGELEEWQARDPLIIARQRPARATGWTSRSSSASRRTCRTRSTRWSRSGASAPWPDPEDAVTEFKAS